MSRSRRSRCPRLTALAVALAAAVPLVAAVPPARSPARAAPDECPAPYPIEDLAPGQPVHGLTVESGMDPDPFTGEVLGVLRNGIALGTDMILVEATSDAIDRAGGIWSGMSGSPVYAEDGRLIGAIAYGLAFGASPIAGVTPAAAMYGLLGPGAAPTGATNVVDLPDRLGAEIVASGAATPAEADSGLTRLTLPLAVSGLRAARRRALAERLGDRYQVTPYASSAASGVLTAAPLVAGGNVAASMTRGDVTIGAVGTVTAVCGSDALLFGHPFTWSGRTTLGAHRARAILVHPGSSVEAGFKIAEPLALAGTVRQDRTVGLRAKLGERPGAIPITGTASRPGRSATSATTRVERPGFIVDGTWIHLLSHLDSVNDRIGPGSVRMDWTATGRRADGTRWRLHRHDMDTGFDAAYFGADEVAGRLWQLRRNRFERITVGRVTYDGTISRSTRVGTVVGAQHRRADGRWVRVPDERRLRLVAGTDVALRALVRYPRTDTVTKVPVTVHVPNRPGRRGRLVIAGGSGGSRGPRQAPTSFDDLLRAARRAPSGDDVVATLVVSTPYGKVVREGRTRHDTVVGGSTAVGVLLVGPSPSGPRG